MLSPSTQNLDLVVMASYVLLKSPAADHPGLPEILWEAVRDVLGSSARPWYTVLENSHSAAVKEY